MKLPDPLVGDDVCVRKRVVEFSFWPTRDSKGRFPGLNSILFALDPWTIIRDSISARCSATSQTEARAYIEQAEDFFRASQVTEIAAARPLLLYYCFLNMAKALVITEGRRGSLDQAQHGLSARLIAPNRELVNATLDAFPSPPPPANANIFSEFLQTVSGVALPATTSFALPLLVPQVLSGHRLWAFAAKKQERFVAIRSVRFLSSAATSQVWMRLYFFLDDLDRLGLTRKRLLEESRLAADFRAVKVDPDTQSQETRALVAFEQVAPLTYTMSPSDHLQALVDRLRPMIWATVGSSPPYRRYYTYVAPMGEHNSILPQTLSVYAIAFYLGSITRYRPHHFDKILAGPFGSRIAEFITGQPLQFIYLIASEFARREITRPSIV